MKFSELVYYLLNPKRESTQVGLNRFFRLLGKPGIYMTEQAFGKARSHFDHSPFETMMRETVKEQYDTEQGLQHLNGRYIFAIDGTTIALPDKKELREAFGASGRKKDSATASASILYDVTNDWIVDAAMDRYSHPERDHAKSHIDYLKGLSLQRDCLLVFDRGYPSAELIRYIEKQGFHYLMRCPTKWNAEVDETPSTDFIITLSGGPSLRVIKFPLPSGEVEVLISNLFEEPEAGFPKLYALRWPVEGKYDIVKNKLEIGCFSGYSKNAILQDFWVCMLLCNIAATAKQEADLLVQRKRTGSRNKLHYIPNVNQLIGSLKDQFICACLLSDSDIRDSAIDFIILEISRAVVPIRPGRSFWRNPWPRKSRNHFNLKSNV